MNLRNCMAAAFGVLLACWPGLAMSQSYPNVRCFLNEDRSELLVTAVNPSSDSYSCIAQCHFNRAGQRAFEGLNCSFSLPANSDEHTVCSQQGDGPDYFAEARPSRFTCQPR